MFHIFFGRRGGNGHRIHLLLQQKSIFNPRFFFGVDLQILHEAQTVGPHEFDEADKENAVGTWNEHEIEELRRRPENGSVDVGLQKLDLRIRERGKTVELVIGR